MAITHHFEGLFLGKDLIIGLRLQLGLQQVDGKMVGMMVEVRVMTQSHQRVDR